MNYIKTSTGLEKTDQAKLRVYEDSDALIADLSNLPVGSIVSSKALEGGGDIDDTLAKLQSRVTQIESYIPIDTTVNNTLVNQGTIDDLDVGALDTRVTQLEATTAAITPLIPDTATSANKLVDQNSLDSTNARVEYIENNYALQGDLEAEVTRSTNKDDDLQADIDGLDTRVQTIEGLIPGSASTSNILVDQAQVDALDTRVTDLEDAQWSITGAASTIVDDDLTPDRAVISDANGKVAASSVTSTEVGYLSGVTSNIQDQLDEKTSKFKFRGKRLLASSSNVDSYNYTTEIVEMQNAVSGYGIVYSKGSPTNAADANFKLFRPPEQALLFGSNSDGTEGGLASLARPTSSGNYYLRAYGSGNTPYAWVSEPANWSIPTVPTTNGTYTLQAVRTSSGVTYSWVTNVVGAN